MKAKDIKTSKVQRQRQNVKAEDIKYKDKDKI